MLSKQLAESNNIKELIIDIISHDLVNLVTVINGIADDMFEEDPDDEGVQLLKRCSGELLRLLNNVTALSRVVKREEITKGRHNLADMVKKVGEDREPDLQASGMTIEYHLPENLVVRANPIIELVFQNYVSNSIKHASAGKRIIIEGEKKGNSVVVGFKDFGETIPQKDRRRIFEVGTRLEDGAKPGRGLGLAIAKRIAELVGGEVWVDANKPTGNIFYLMLPADDSE